MQDRAIATRAALLDAALDCLVELGYHATTTTEVANRAGVSRGAQLHHFPTKAQLLTAALEQLYERRIAEFRDAFASSEPRVDQLEAAIDLLWSMFQGPTFVAWIELWVAARTDSELRPALVRANRRFVDQSEATFRELFPTSAATDPGFQELARNFAFTFMDGLALGSLVPGGQEDPPDELIGALKVIARMFTVPQHTDQESSK